MTRRRLGTAAAALAMALVAGCDFQKAGPTRPDGEGPGVNVGDVATDFTLLDQNGQPRSLSDFRGKVILLDLSTMWCSFCQKEAEGAEEMYQQYRSQGFVMINALWADYNGNPMTIDDAGAWSDRYGISFPILADVDESVWRTYSNQPDIPLNLVIDRDFIIQYRAPGFNETSIRQAIESSL